MDAGAPALAPPLPPGYSTSHTVGSFSPTEIQRLPKETQRAGEQGGHLNTGNLQMEGGGQPQSRQGTVVGLASFMKTLHNITEASPAKSNSPGWIRSVLGDIQNSNRLRWQKGFELW